MADDFIPRKDLEKWLRTEMASLDGEEDKEFVIERLREEIPAADVQPVRHGRWYRFTKVSYDPQSGLGFGRYMWKCDACNIGEEETKMPYCPNCGAHMVDGEAYGQTD